LPRFARNDSGGKARNDTPSFVIARHTSAEAIPHTPPRLPRFARNDNLKGLAMAQKVITQCYKHVKCHPSIWTRSIITVHTIPALLSLNSRANATRFLSEGTTSSHFLVFNPQSGFIQKFSCGNTFRALFTTFFISLVFGMTGE